MIEENEIMILLQHLHFNLCFGGEGGDAGPVTCTCASSGVQEVVVWTALTSACHSEGSIFGPEKARKIRDANTGLPSSTPGMQAGAATLPLRDCN